MDVATLAELLRETAQHHDHYEKTHPKHDWWDWYAPYLSARQNGSTPEVLSRKLFANVNSLFANEAMDTRLRARRAPFGVPGKKRSDRGKSRLPSKVNAIIETAIKKIYLTTETARCRGCHRGNPA